MKKYCYLLFFVLMMAAFTGCGHEHTWKDATCTAAKECVECGEIEGEPLGHDFAEATCTLPRTCKRCGMTEGEALEHDLSEATFDQAPTCRICGVQVGEKLISALEKEGLSISKQGPNSFLATQYSRNRETGIIYDVADFELPYSISVTETLDENDNRYKYVKAYIDMDLTMWSFDYQYYSVNIFFMDRNAGYGLAVGSVNDEYVPFSLPTKDGNIDVELMVNNYMADDYLSESYTYTLRCPADYDDAVFCVMYSDYNVGDDINAPSSEKAGDTFYFPEYKAYRKAKFKGYIPQFFSCSNE